MKTTRLQATTKKTFYGFEGVLAYYVRGVKIWQDKSQIIRQTEAIALHDALKMKADYLANNRI